jgi:hypothetical protein
VVKKILAIAALNSGRVRHDSGNPLVREKVGGGGRSRTYDAADMSHADSDPNLLDLLTEILLEADDGGIGGND